MPSVEENLDTAKEWYKDAKYDRYWKHYGQVLDWFKRHYQVKHEVEQKYGNEARQAGAATAAGQGYSNWLAAMQMYQYQFQVAAYHAAAAAYQPHMYQSQYPSQYQGYGVPAWGPSQQYAAHGEATRKHGVPSGFKLPSQPAPRASRKRESQKVRECKEIMFHNTSLAQLLKLSPLFQIILSNFKHDISLLSG